MLHTQIQTTCVQLSTWRQHVTIRLEVCTQTFTYVFVLMLLHPRCVCMRIQTCPIYLSYKYKLKNVHSQLHTYSQLSLLYLLFTIAHLVMVCVTNTADSRPHDYHYQTASSVNSVKQPTDINFMISNRKLKSQHPSKTTVTRHW